MLCHDYSQAFILRLNVTSKRLVPLACHFARTVSTSYNQRPTQFSERWMHLLNSDRVKWRGEIGSLNPMHYRANFARSIKLTRFRILLRIDCPRHGKVLSDRIWLKVRLVSLAPNLSRQVRRHFAQNQSLSIDELAVIRISLLFR